jgi:hypothetical protein
MDETASHMEQYGFGQLIRRLLAADEERKSPGFRTGYT